MSKDFQADLETYLRAGYQIIGINTTQEARIEAIVKSLAKKLQMDFVTWDIAEGFSGPKAAADDPKLNPPHAALQAFGDEGGPFKKDTIAIFRDLDDFMNDVRVRRWVRTLAEGNRLVNQRIKRPIIITGPSLSLHPRLRSCVTMVDFELPDEEQLGRTLEFVLSSIRRSEPDKADCSEQLQESVITNMLGLTTSEAENTLSRCAVKHGGLKDPVILQTIKDEKAAIVKKSQVLTYIPEEDQTGRDAIGGYDMFLPWLDRRSRAYSKEARAVGLDYPKGAVLVGPPGTGKSMVAVAAARLLGLPGYTMDVGSVFGHLVGESEGRMRDALKQIEAQQGCVLLIDEVDKALGGAHNSGGDSGVTRRVFGQLLSWLAEKKDRTFVIVTLNRTAGLPPEFFRAGRFDAVFSTDLPHEQERDQILKIHLRKRGVSPEALGMSEGDWSEIIRKTEGFVGSELEEVVREARYSAFADRAVGIPSFEEMMAAASEVTPVSVLDREGVEEIRQFCKDRAKPVTSPPKKPRRGRSRNVDLSGSNES